MSNGKVAVSQSNVHNTPTFRELVAERRALNHQLEMIHREAIAKCVNEAWHDCLTVNWNIIEKRSR